MRKKIVGGILSLLILAALLAYLLYSWIYFPNTIAGEDRVLLIPEGSSYQDVRTILRDSSIVQNTWSFELTARLMKYDKGTIHPGRYVIFPETSNRQLVTRLRIGDRSPIRVTVSTGRTMADIYRILADQLEADSAQLARAFENPVTLEQMGLTKSSLITLIVPDSYEMFWSTKPAEVVKRMEREYHRFWEYGERSSKCSALGLSRTECITLASIVESETNLKSERPTMAGVYLNRLQRGIPLQADPTVVFAVGDFEIRRVLNRHLEVDSPYNTYMYQGLPPGPICLPSKSSIDAVLNAEEHDYLFFCAKPGYDGAHLFAKTNSEHERNAAIYRSWLDSENIKS